MSSTVDEPTAEELVQPTSIIPQVFTSTFPSVTQFFQLPSDKSPSDFKFYNMILTVFTMQVPFCLVKLTMPPAQLASTLEFCSKDIFPLGLKQVYALSHSFLNEILTMIKSSFPGIKCEPFYYNYSRQISHRLFVPLPEGVQITTHNLSEILYPTEDKYRNNLCIVLNFLAQCDILAEKTMFPLTKQEIPTVSISTEKNGLAINFYHTVLDDTISLFCALVNGLTWFPVNGLYTSTKHSVDVNGHTELRYPNLRIGPFVEFKATFDVKKQQPHVPKKFSARSGKNTQWKKPTTTSIFKDE
jgi:hypothetical protein